MQSLPLALEGLAAFRQFIVYKLVPSATRHGKTDKLPIDWKTGAMPAKNSGASSIWTDATSALDAVARFGSGYGVGFSFAESDPFFFLDVDNCLEPDGWSPLARSLVAAFPGAAVEVSQSGRGLHIIGTGKPPPHACKNLAYGLELYHADRFVALTGTNAVGDVRANFDYCLPWLVENYFPPSSDGTPGAGWTDFPVDEWRGPTDDDKLVERALRSKSSASVFGNRATFADLWFADVEALSAAYPDPDRGYDASSADAALAQHLAFWTGKNCERVRQIMQRSALVREKWNREDYLPMTISKACARQVEVLQDKPLTIEYDTPDGLAAAPSMVTGGTYLSTDQQIDLFKGCVYVTDEHRILVPGGVMLKPDQFRVIYGGYSFPMDPANERISRNAWECFTESQSFRAPRAETSCFRPDLAPGSIIEGRVNTWWPIETPRREGDPSPFLNHLSKIAPDQKDREILLAYMAAVVQHPGVKFQWAPLVQGVEGNGKSLLISALAFAVGGKYTHLPKAEKIAPQFNSWMLGKIFIGVHDVYVPSDNRDVIEQLKPMITEGSSEIEGKGRDQVTKEVCCNFMLNTNLKGALRKTRNDRRFAPFYTPQQEKADLVRDGMTGGYFQRLYKWMKHDGGFEIVNHYLRTYQIPDELNPALGHIAPVTSSTEQAIIDGLGRVEQEILEAVSREEVGFRGGWISSMAVDKLLERIGAARSIPPNRRREIMASIGYDYHPGLIDGRTNNPVLPDGGKPRLFIRHGSDLAKIAKPSEIATAYSFSQNT